MDRFFGVLGERGLAAFRQTFGDFKLISHAVHPRRGAADFWSKNQPWAPKGRLILRFSAILENLKNDYFLKNYGNNGTNCTLFSENIARN